MDTALIYFNSISGIEKFKDLDFTYSIDLEMFINDEKVEPVNNEKLNKIIIKNKAIPKTSQPSTGKMVEVIEEALKSYDNAIIITPSKYLSGTHQNSLLASKEFEEGKVSVVESKSFALSEFILATEFVNNKDKLNIKDMSNHLQNVAKSLETFILPGSFDHLKMSGRVSYAKALVASFMRVKLLIRHLEPKEDVKKDSIAEVYFKERGYNSLFKKIEELLDSKKIKRIYYSTICCDEKLLNNFIELVKTKDIELIKAGEGSNIIFSHIGPKSFGFCLELSE